jgi:hypothetical protein
MCEKLCPVYFHQTTWHYIPESCPLTFGKLKDCSHVEMKQRKVEHTKGSDDGVDIKERA